MLIVLSDTARGSQTAVARVESQAWTGVAYEKLPQLVYLPRDALLQDVSILLPKEMFALILQGTVYDGKKRTKK